MVAQITPLSDPPSRADPENFVERSDQFMSELPVFAIEANVLAAEVNAKTEAAALSAISAADSGNRAASAATAATATVGATQWVSGTDYTAGVCVWSPASQQIYRRKTSGAGAIDPSVDLSNWAFVGVKPVLARSARTSNTMIGAADSGTLIDITSGTFTQTFAAVLSSLGDGWWCYLRNSGTGDITLDPDGAELIDGLTSYVMYPGECRLVQCDGVALRSVVLNSFYKVFTASGVFTKPPGYARFEGLLWAAGGGGAKDPYFVTGGGGGACAPISFPFSKIGATEVVTIGAGGSPSATASGNAGGGSSFGALVAAYGGKGAGTAGTAGDGGSSFYSDTNSAVLGGASNAPLFVAFYGGGGGSTSSGRGRTVFGGAGGAGIYSSTAQPVYSTTIYGGAGGASGDAVNGSDGVAPAGGGGSTRTGTQSGAGARGELRIWGVI